MLFPTATFAIFFTSVFGASWALRDTVIFRKLFLLSASYVFYGWWDVRFVALLAASAFANYLCAIALGHLQGPGYRKAAVIVGILLNLATLGFFKYYNFFLDSLQTLMISAGLQRELPFLDIILPVGISFFTFQGISYIIDVYRRACEPSRSMLDVMLYISFFPQLVAGPIVRATDFLPQLEKPVRLTYTMVSLGFLLIAMGLFKKMVIANYLATDIVDQSFFDPSVHAAADLMMALWAYSVQVYCDFSAYSEIAIGCALLLGYRFNINFNQPYRAASVSEFWRRWHMSLSSWLRDYVYRPLRGPARNMPRIYFAVFCTMFLCGIWHGAAWTFALWGTMHGVWLMAERIVGYGQGVVQSWIPWLIGVFVTFNMVSLSRIFFRSEDFFIVDLYWTSLVTNWAMPIELTTPFVVGMVVLGMSFHFLPSRTVEFAEGTLTRLAWPLIGLLFGLSLVAIDAVGPGTVTPFIYYQF